MICILFLLNFLFLVEGNSLCSGIQGYSLYRLQQEFPDPVRFNATVNYYDYSVCGTGGDLCNSNVSVVCRNGNRSVADSSAVHVWRDKTTLWAGPEEAFGLEIKSLPNVDCFTGHTTVIVFVCVDTPVGSGRRVVENGCITTLFWNTTLACQNITTSTSTSSTSSTTGIGSSTSTSTSTSASSTSTAIGSSTSTSTSSSDSDDTQLFIGASLGSSLAAISGLFLLIFAGICCLCCVCGICCLIIIVIVILTSPSVGLLVVPGALGGAIMIIRKRTHKEPEVINNDTKLDDWYDNLFTSRDKFYEINPDELIFVRKIGSGTFGEVYQGEWKHAKVAIKKIRCPSQNVDDMMEEVKILHNVGNHPNVLRYLGISVKRFKMDSTGLLQTFNSMLESDIAVDEMTEIFIIMDFYENGSLEGYLRSHRDTIDFNQLLSFSIEACNSIMYLHSSNVIHRDIAARNFLVGADLHIKIADFGLSRYISNDTVGVTESKIGPVRWMAPEALKGNCYSTESDIWSFGVLLWEIWSYANTPYSNKTNIVELVSDIAHARIQLDPLPGKAKEIYQLIRKLTKYNPEERISLEEAKERLVEIYERNKNLQNQLVYLSTDTIPSFDELFLPTS